MMRTWMRFSQVALCAALTSAAPAAANGAKFVVFDPVDSLYTFPVANNVRSEIAGYYFDGNFTEHGFIRSPEGRLATFDAPNSLGTMITGLNDEGATTGYYADSAGGIHGFVRTAAGIFVSFDAPDASAQAGGTEPSGINLIGEVSGIYYDSSGSGIPHAFIRAANGKVTEYDVPGADQGTLVGAPNDEGSVSGDYHVTANEGFVSHGFVRSPTGAFTSFDVPGAGDTFAFGLNDQDAVIGLWVVDHGDVEHGYLRERNGKFTKFDAPGAGTGTGTPPNQQGTEPLWINTLGEITGDFLDASSVYHGFLRGCDGKIITFDAPSAGTTAFAYQGTNPVSINFGGEITGSVTDSAGLTHGFLRE